MKILLGFARFIDFFKDSSNYYLVQEYGGNDLFDFVVKQGENLDKNRLDIKEWHLQVQFIFSEIAKALHYFHYSKNMCHLDMSLENTLIDKNLVPKIIDFGLSEVFVLGNNNNNNNNINSNKGPNRNTITFNKFVGKQQYAAPKVKHTNREDHTNKRLNLQLFFCFCVCLDQISQC